MAVYLLLYLNVYKNDLTQAIEKKKHVDEGVEAGREYVEACVTYVHYVERVYDDAKGEASAHGEAEGTKGESQHKH